MAVPRNPAPTRLGELLQGDLLGGKPVLAASFGDGLPDEDLATWRDSGLGVAELRIDWFSSYEPAYVVEQVRRFAPLPTIATIRASHEGGEWDGSDEERLALFRAVLGEVDGVDVELSSGGILAVVTEAKRLGRTTIISYHDFQGTPGAAGLGKLARAAKSAGADIVKLATTARSWDDLRALAGFTVQHARHGIIVLAMGPFGPLSRVFFPALGSCLVYARADSPSATGAGGGTHTDRHAVPGQLGFAENLALLRRFYPDFDRAQETAPGDGP